jgi:hypothetical protein
MLSECRSIFVDEFLHTFSPGGMMEVAKSMQRTILSPGVGKLQDTRQCLEHLVHNGSRLSVELRHLALLYTSFVEPWLPPKRVA